MNVRQGMPKGNVKDDDFDLGLIAADASIVPTRIQTLSVLGQGRAAQARLVSIKTDDGQQIRCVEKVFSPGWLTRTIYRSCFQASFAYQHNQDAILASYYRRRVAWAITRLAVPEASVAVPLYVRWDSKSQAYVLASELVVGRGIIPQAIDPFMIRRWLRKKTSTSEKCRANQGDSNRDDDELTDRTPPTEEIQELLGIMQRLEKLFIESGLTGTGWQVCKRAIVSTANLLRTPKGYVSVDLESGIPALLVSTYLLSGLRMGSLPMFDDLSPAKLLEWVGNNRDGLESCLTSEQLEQLDRDVDHLIQHSARWKESEPAILRRPFRLFTSEFGVRYRQRILNDWARRQIIDSEEESRLRRTNRRLSTTMVYWLGWIPGRLGCFLQGCSANAETRQRIDQFLRDTEFRKQVIEGYQQQQIEKLKGSRRVPAVQLESISMPGLFLHVGLSKFTPIIFHRMLADPTFRRHRMTRLAVLCLSSRFQNEYGRWIIRRRIEAWQNENRLTLNEKSKLSRELNHPAIEEYLRGFGAHIGLKFLLPFLLPLKAIGAAASLASGNPLYFLFMLLLLPMLRTVVTLWKMFASKRPASDFRDAIIVGALPSVGSLAFPVQIYSTCPMLSTFLMRDFAAQVGRRFPIYGGKDSRTEIAFIKSINVIAEILDLWLGLLRSRKSVDANESTVNHETFVDYPAVGLSRINIAEVGFTRDSAKSNSEKAVSSAGDTLLADEFPERGRYRKTLRHGRWDRAAMVQMRLIQREWREAVESNNQIEQDVGDLAGKIENGVSRSPKAA